MGELAMERSGPERFLTPFSVLEQALPLFAQSVDDRRAMIVGSILANLRVLRRMSLGIAAMLEEGENPATAASLVKEMGNRFENEIIARVRELVSDVPRNDWPPGFDALLRDAILHLPSNSLRGGTTEILRGIIAREMGMR